jgi:hypothetical protein
LKGLVEKRTAVVLKRAGTQPEYAATLTHDIHYVGTFLVLSKSVDDNGTAVGEHCLYPKLTAHCMNVISQSAEVHVGPLLNTGDGALRYIQHLGHIRLSQPSCAAQLLQRHTL